jgi:hypothetical protein
MGALGVARRPASVLCALVLSLFWFAGLAALDRARAQNVINPDFALPSAAGAAGGYIIDPPTTPQTGWKFENYAGGANNISGVQQNGSGLGGPNAPNGEQQTGFIYNLGTISQNIDFKQAGDYTLSFYIAARAGGLPSGSAQSIMVTMGANNTGPLSRKAVRASTRSRYRSQSRKRILRLN